MHQIWHTCPLPAASAFTSHPSLLASHPHDTCETGHAAVRVGVAIVAQRVQEERLCGSQRHLEHYANATDMARWVKREGARWEKWARRRGWPGGL